MKRLLILSILFTFSTTGLFAQSARQGLHVEAGTTSGTFTFSSTDAETDAYALDQTPTGTMQNVYYSKIFESNLILGAGMQSYTATGTSEDTGTLTISGVAYTFTVAVDQEVAFSGLFGMVGYNLNIGSIASFQPQLRIGVSNSLTYDHTVTLTSGTFTTDIVASETGTVSPMVIVLPFNFNLGDSIELGVQAHTMNAGIEYIADTDTYTSVIDAGVSVSVAYYF
ncbi:MAG: hypothetical protein QNL04_12970 [SAR324 cluster bacterium]|nr:hypothetical protein [SAR324 cluster bacterium]